MDHPSGSTIPSIFRNASTTRSVPKSVRSFDESPSSPTSSSSGFTGKDKLCSWIFGISNIEKQEQYLDFFKKFGFIQTSMTSKNHKSQNWNVAELQGFFGQLVI